MAFMHYTGTGQVTLTGDGELGFVRVEDRNDSLDWGDAMPLTEP
jgi:hypothetical protein